MVYSKFCIAPGRFIYNWSYDTKHLAEQVSKQVLKDIRFVSAREFFLKASFLTIKDFFHNA